MLALSFLKVVKLQKTHHNLAFIKLKKEDKILCVQIFNHDAPAEDKVGIVFVTQKGKTTLSKFSILSKPRLERL